jgi:aquaporin Z
MSRTLRAHLPEYLIEAVALAAFLVSAAAFTVLLEHPASAVHRVLPDPVVRRVLMGVAMGGTLVAIVYSPWGRRSGAHMNPALTLAFWRLGKVRWTDAAGYMAAQFLGAVAVMALLRGLAGRVLSNPAVNYVATTPGRWGTWAAWLAEAAISLVLVYVVLGVAGSRASRFTGLVAGFLVAAYIAIESPVSGMSMNPARTLGPALVAGDPSTLWLYFTAPTGGMLAGALLWHTTVTPVRPVCAKYDHDPRYRCIHCGHVPKGAHAHESR